MVNFNISANASALSLELDWFSKVLEKRLERYFKKEGVYPHISRMEPPPLSPEETLYGHFISHYHLTPPERLVIALTLAPHLRPQALDMLAIKNTTLDRPFTEFGGKTGSVFMPTVQTAMFLLAGPDMAQWLEYLPMFSQEHFFSDHGVLEFGILEDGLSDAHRTISISRDTLDMLTTGTYRFPKFGKEFPAKRMDTPHVWDDLILEPQVMNQLLEIQAWIEHGHTVLTSLPLGRKLKPGYCALFFGPPGTGKTMAASLLGKNSGRDVFRIDLSMVVSKYIGETEKNLEKVFNQAQHRDWILFFDEADALFGKRTDISDAHDRFANQEVSYLLQRIEDFSGMVFLATNRKDNLDEAFLRRIQSFVHFPLPRHKERLDIWTNAFTRQTMFEKGVDLNRIARDYELSGGSIMNVVRYAGLMMVKYKKNYIREPDILEGIRREIQKEGRTL